MRNFTSVLMNTDKIFFESESPKGIMMKDNMTLAHSDTANIAMGYILTCNISFNSM